MGFGGLNSEDRMLDANCGVRRIDRHLAGYLTGSYECFDIVPKAAAKCHKVVTPRWPHLRFVFAEPYNPRSQS